MGYKFNIRIYNYMILCLFIAPLLMAPRIINVYNGCTYSYGINTSVLRPGDIVVVSDSGETEIDRTLVGASCAVILDFTDIDSAYPYREVQLRVLNGPHAGEHVKIERQQLLLK
jgi:hypothetical protein